MKAFTPGIICLLALIPWAARAQEEAPKSSEAGPAVEGSVQAAADPLAEQARRLEGRARALEQALAGFQGPAAAPTNRRTFGLGLSGGGGVIASIGYGATSGPGGSGSLVIGQLPSVEVRFFLSNGMSLDLSVPVGDILERPLRGGGFAVTSELFWNFNTRVAPGLHLVLGPGLGASFGGSVVPGGMETATLVGGEVRLALQAGAEFLAAGGHLGIALLVRPRASLFLWDEWGTPRAAPVAGLVGLVSLSYYVIAH